MDKVDNGILVKLYFNSPPTGEGADLTYLCKCGKTRKQKKGTGNSNLLSHIKDFEHKEEYVDAYNIAIAHGEGAMDSFIAKVSSKARDYYSWMEWIIMTDQPQVFVENKLNRKYTNIRSPITVKTLIKYMELTVDKVREEIKHQLPLTFGIIFDGWSVEGEHYIALYATASTSRGIVTRLLACGVQDLPDEDIGENANSFGFSAEDLGDYLFDVLASYDRSFESIEFFTGDNCSVNKALADKIEVWLKNVKSIERKVSFLYFSC